MATEKLGTREKKHTVHDQTVMLSDLICLRMKPSSAIPETRVRVGADKIGKSKKGVLNAQPMYILQP